MKHLGAECRGLSRTLAIVASALMTVVACKTTTGPSNTAPTYTVYAASDTVLGKTYSQWADAWQTWFFSLPTNATPVNDNAPPETGQSGKVFFLCGHGGQLDSNGRIPSDAHVFSRAVSVPAGTLFFFPILNAEMDTMSMPTEGGTEQMLRDSARVYLEKSEDISADVDGHTVPNVNLYRCQTSLLTLTLPDSNVFQPVYGAGTYRNCCVSDGYWLMVGGMGVGEHTIHFKATVKPAGVYFEVLYKITVTP